MKKSLIVLTVGMLFILSSCGSSWNCKKRYCDTDTNKTEAVVVITNDNATIGIPT